MAKINKLKKQFVLKGKKEDTDERERERNRKGEGIE
jgi:hypothetical protein